MRIVTCHATVWDCFKSGRVAKRHDPTGSSSGDHGALFLRGKARRQSERFGEDFALSHQKLAYRGDAVAARMRERAMTRTIPLALLVAACSSGADSAGAKNGAVVAAPAAMAVPPVRETEPTATKATGTGFQGFWARFRQAR